MNEWFFTTVGKCTCSTKDLMLSRSFNNHDNGDNIEIPLNCIHIQNTHTYIYNIYIYTRVHPILNGVLMTATDYNYISTFNIYSAKSS